MIEIKNKRTYSGPGRYVGRPTPLGNLFSHLKSKDPSVTMVGSRDEACDLYSRYFYCDHSDDVLFTEQLDSLVEEYKNKGYLVLICWCFPERCHAETIRQEILNRCR